ncbi:MAG: hypothetical protein K2I64_04325 [Muribaculaceae bacterium]|nr:hypothetical protein [Muribaculaceae bacterium]
MEKDIYQKDHNACEDCKNFTFREALSVLYHDGGKLPKRSKDDKKSSTERTLKRTVIQSVSVPVLIVVLFCFIRSESLTFSPDTLKSLTGTAMVIISILVGAAMMALPLVISNPVFSKFDPRTQTQKNEVTCTAAIFIMLQITMLAVCLCMSLLSELWTVNILTYITGAVMCYTVFFCVIADLKIILQIALYSISNVNIKS